MLVRWSSSSSSSAREWRLLAKTLPALALFFLLALLYLSCFSSCSSTFAFASLSHNLRRPPPILHSNFSSRENSSSLLPLQRSDNPPPLADRDDRTRPAIQGAGNKERVADFPAEGAGDFVFGKPAREEISPDVGAAEGVSDVSADDGDGGHESSWNSTDLYGDPEQEATELQINGENSDGIDTNGTLPGDRLGASDRSSGNSEEFPATEMELPSSSETPIRSSSQESQADHEISPIRYSENPGWVLRLEQDLSTAKRAIAAAPVSTSGDLRAPLYHNVSAFKKSYELMEQLFRIYIYGEGSPPLVHTGPTVGIYASEGRFIDYLHRNRRFVVKDPTKAHMFFLPYSVANMVIQLYVPDSHTMLPITTFITDYVNLIASKHPFWNRTRGADHFFVSCHDWGPATARGHPELRTNSVKVVCNADLTEEFVVEKDVSLPEIYLHAAKPPSRLGGPPPRKRPYLAFFAGRMHGRLRPILLQHWKNKDPDMKIYEELPAKIARKTSYIRHLKMSKFCICAMGYEVNSPRIVEAIYYDCVPVIIADNFVLPFGDVLNWEAFSVVMEEKEVPRLKQVLLSISTERYRSMQAMLQHVRQHFVWHNVPSRYDAFHMILHSLWLRRLASLPSSVSE